MLWLHWKEGVEDDASFKMSEKAVGGTVFCWQIRISLG